MGVEVIITDHHIPHNGVPNAVASLNPKIPGSDYPLFELCGAGIGFKLIQGLFEFYGQPWDSGLLELAALGTIADLVPLLDEKRYRRAIASSCFRFPLAVSAVFTSKTWHAANIVAQNAVNTNNEILTLFVGTPFAFAALKFPPVE